MLGAIVGDVVGSIYEFDGIKTTEFPFLSEDCTFTDDTIITLAIADTLMKVFPSRPGTLRNEDYEKLEFVVVESMREYGKLYPHPMGGYGTYFGRWLFSKNPRPYGSYGNGSAMRISSVAWAFDSLDDVEKCAEIVTRVTHDHPEGIKGAQATATAIFMARRGKTKAEIRDFIGKRYGYDLGRTIDEIRSSYEFDGGCPGSVPESIISFLDAKDFEHAIRLAVSLGGDADTQAAIAGSIAEGMWGIPDEIADKVFQKLDPFLQDILTRWNQWRKAKLQC